MDTNFPDGSMGEQEQKNAKVFEKIVIAGTVLLTLVCYFASAHPFVSTHKYPALWILPVVFAAWAVYCVVNVLKQSAVTEEQKWPYILLIVLFFASLVAMFYVPAGLSL